LAILPFMGQGKSRPFADRLALLP